MKSVLFPLALAVVFIVTSCQDEEQTTTQHAARFTINIADDLNAETAADYPDEISVDLVAEANDGTVTKQVAFSKVGGEYVSEPVELRPGNYKITSFLIDDPNLESVPGSLRDFSVNDHSNATVSIGSTAAVKTPRGYSLQLIVYAEINGKRKPIEAAVTISTYEGDFFEFYLSAKPNRVVLTGNPDGWHTLTIDQDGYEYYTTDFVYSELEKKRLEITLTERPVQPGPAVTFEPSATYFSMWIEVMGQGSLVLDWGQGEPELLEFNVDPENETATAFFSRDQGYAVRTPAARITGDIHLLKALYFEYAVDALDVEYATNLEGLAFSGGDIPVLDLDVNTELQWLHFNGSDAYLNIGQVILPQQHGITELIIQPGTDWPSIADLDYIIDNIHVNAVAGSFTNGSVNLGGAAVSADAVSKLTELQNSNGWTIVY